MCGEGGRSIEERTVTATPQVYALPMRPLESLLDNLRSKVGVPLRAKKACFAFHAPWQMRTPAAPNKIRAATKLWAGGRHQILNPTPTPNMPLSQLDPYPGLPWYCLGLHKSPLTALPDTLSLCTPHLTLFQKRSFIHITTSFKKGPPPSNGG